MILKWESLFWDSKYFLCEYGNFVIIWSIINGDLPVTLYSIGLHALTDVTNYPIK